MVLKKVNLQSLINESYRLVKLLLLSITLLCIGGGLYSQNRFTGMSEFPSSDNAWSVAPLDTGYILLSGWQYNAPNSNVDALLLRMDQYGNITFVDSLVHDKYNLGTKMLTYNGNVVLCGAVANIFGASNDTAFLEITNKIGDSRSYIRFPAPKGSALYRPLVLKDNYYLAGYTSEHDSLSANDSADVLFVSIDTAGHPRFVTHFGRNRNDYVVDANVIGNDEIVMAGFTLSDVLPLGTNTYSDGYLAIADTLGHKLWDQHYDLGYKFSEQFLAVSPSPDGTIVAAGWCTPLDAGIHIPQNALIFKVDTAGVRYAKCFWDTANDAYSNSHWWNSVITNILVLPDWTIIAAGYFDSRDDSLKYQGFLMQLDDQANILWREDYGGNRDDLVTDLIQTSDHGYLIVGNSKSDGAVGSPGYVPLDTWIIKTDSLGCAKANCSIGMLEIPNSTGIKLFPNPVKDFVRIEVEDLNGDVFKLYDITKRKILEVSIVSKSSEIALPSSMGSGMYIWQVENNGRISRSGKLVKE